MDFARSVSDAVLAPFEASCTLTSVTFAVAVLLGTYKVLAFVIGLVLGIKRTMFSNRCFAAPCGVLCVASAVPVSDSRLNDVLLRAVCSVCAAGTCGRSTAPGLSSLAPPTASDLVRPERWAPACAPRAPPHPGPFPCQLSASSSPSVA